MTIKITMIIVIENDYDNCDDNDYNNCDDDDDKAPVSKIMVMIMIIVMII